MRRTDANTPETIGIGRAIRQLRLRRGMTQDTLGKRAEIHPTWISHIETGRINPTWGNVNRIARGLEVSLVDFAALAEENMESLRRQSPETEATPDEGTTDESNQGRAGGGDRRRNSPARS